MEQTINILVVDDEQIVLDSVQKHLSKEDYAVHTALHVNDALEQLKRENIDVVLTDLMMPEIDGLELMAMIKEDHPSMPVIMITGYATINTALQATRLGAFDYIAKPFTRKELLGVLRRAAELVLASSRAGDAVPEGASADGARSGIDPNVFKSVGDDTWLMLIEDGSVRLGVEHSFLQTVGIVQSVYLPNKGDELRQGAPYIQIIATDLRSHTVLSPLSGTVVEVNQRVIDDPESALQDPFGEGWLVRLQPSRFDIEIKELGL